MKGWSNDENRKVFQVQLNEGFIACINYEAVWLQIKSVNLIITESTLQNRILCGNMISLFLFWKTYFIAVNGNELHLKESRRIWFSLAIIESFTEKLLQNIWKCAFAHNVYTLLNICIYTSSSIIIVFYLVVPNLTQ